MNNHFSKNALSCPVENSENNRSFFVSLLVHLLGFETIKDYAKKTPLFETEYWDYYVNTQQQNPQFNTVFRYFKELMNNTNTNPLLFPSFQFLENTHLSGDKLVGEEIRIIKQEFQNSKVMIISGGGGLGKTTLAKTISLSSELYNDGILPIYFPIAHLNQQNLINGKKDWLLSEILRYWTNQRANDTFTGLFAKIMDDTIDSYLILDGLNEANKEVYDSIIDELVFLLDPNGRYKRMHILIFSRSSRDIKKDLKKKILKQLKNLEKQGINLVYVREDHCMELKFNVKIQCHLIFIY